MADDSTSAAADAKFSEATENNAPTIEEAHDQLVKEGLIADDEGNITTPDDGAEASDVPEKFRNRDGSINVEALAKSYSELEKMKGQKADEAEGDTDDEAGYEEEAGSEDDEYDEEGEISAAEEAAEAAGLKLDNIQSEYDANGGLSAETYDALEEAGYPPAMVDVYIDGLLARAGTVRSAGFEAGGGEENYAKIIEWAGANLSDAEIDAYDVTMDSANPTQIEAAVKGLRARYDLSMAGDATTEPEDMISGQRAGGDVYFSQEDVQNDMMDPRYDSSPAFRDAVMRKMERSNI